MLTWLIGLFGFSFVVASMYELSFDIYASIGEIVALLFGFLIADGITRYLGKLVYKKLGRKNK